jgi:23S rRNA (guanosine2251-2'-O)-methyltransferase
MRYAILHDIRSKYNVGAIFRTADAAGVEKIFLTGYTPAPRDRFGRTDQEIDKTSLGASLSVPWEQVPSIEVLIANLKAAGVCVVAVEIAPGSVSLYDFVPPPRVAYIFGNETEGIPPAVLALADEILEIPMAGQKESLNVSVTAGVVLLHHPL